jgi:hypothetical protein
LLLHDGADLTGAVPLIEYAVKIPGEKGTIRRVITFPGDFFISYQDLNVAHHLRTESVKALLNSIAEMLDSHDLAILQHIREDSPNLQALCQCMHDLSEKGFRCYTALTGRRGGVRPWTVNSIASCLRQLSDRVKDSLRKDEIRELVADLETCSPMSLLFPSTRNTLEGRIGDVVEWREQDKALEKPLEALKALLSDLPLLYPYISLPSDKKAYMTTMSRETRRYFRRYGSEYESQGGRFEKITSSRIRDQDIEDYLNLHGLRWGDSSISIRNEATYRFHWDLCRRLASQGCFTLFFALYEGRRIATHSCIDILGRREGYMTGRDPSCDKTRASRLLYLETIIDAIGHGFHTYDLGLGWYGYKESFTRTNTRTLNFFIAPNTSPIDYAKLYVGYECMIPAIVKSFSRGESGSC